MTDRVPNREQLKAHIGGLVQLSTDLFWREGSSFDRKHGRICVLLNTAGVDQDIIIDAEGRYRPWTAQHDDFYARHCLHLLIDGAPKWVQIRFCDVELLHEGADDLQSWPVQGACR